MPDKNIPDSAEKKAPLQPAVGCETAPVKEAEPVVFSAFDWLALALGIALGALWFEVFSFDALMWVPGLGTPAFVLAALGAECLYLRGKVRPTRRGLFLAVCTVLLAVSCGLFGDYKVRMINLAMLSFLTPASALALAGRDFPALEARMIPETFRLFIPGLFRRFTMPFRAIKRGNRSLRGFWTAVLTLVIAFPALAVVVSLLTSADAVFSGLLGRVGEAVARSLDKGRFLVSWLKAAVLGLMLFSFLYSLARPDPERGEEEKAGPAVIPCLPCVTVLTALDLIYAAFAIVQFIFLFGPMRGSFAEEARRGFFQLVAVAGINLLASFVCARASGKGIRAVRILTWALLGLTAVILASAAMRMCLYIGVYGLSLLRAMTLLIMLWIAAALILAGIKTARPEKHVFPALLTGFLVLWAAFSLCDIDSRVADFNRAAFDRGDIREYDAGYIETLGPDSEENRDAFWGNRVLFPRG